MKLYTIPLFTSLLFLTSYSSAQPLIEKIQTMKQMTILVTGIITHGEACANFIRMKPNMEAKNTPTCGKYMAYLKALIATSKVREEFIEINLGDLPFFAHETYNNTLLYYERAMTMAEELNQILRSQ